MALVIVSDSRLASRHSIDYCNAVLSNADTSCTFRTLLHDGQVDNQLLFLFAASSALIALSWNGNWGGCELLC